MAENQTDANSDADNIEDVENVDSSESSPEVDLEPIEDSNGFVSTTDWKEVPKEKEIETSDKEQQEKDTSEKTEHKTKTEETKPKPYHEDPAWQRIIKERDEAAAKAAALESKLSKSEKPKAPEKRGSKVMAMKRDDIVDKFTNDPHSFLKDFAIDIRDEIYSGLDEKNKAEQQKSAQQQAEERQKETLTKFFEDKPDGYDLLKNGSIQKFMQENPGHNAMSAYYQLSQASKAETVGKDEVDKLVKKAVADAEKKFKSELKAMGKASSKVTSISSKKIPNRSDEMKNPDKHGGPRAVAARRYIERMANAQ